LIFSSSQISFFLLIAPVYRPPKELEARSAA
jgi:hypothetical protein